MKRFSLFFLFTVIGYQLISSPHFTENKRIFRINQQSLAVKDRILSKKTDKPLEGANVQVRETARETVSDIQDYLSMNAAKNSTLISPMVKYHDFEHKITKSEDSLMVFIDKDTVSVLMFKKSSKNDQEMIQKTIDYAAANHIKTVFVPNGKYEIEAVGPKGGISLKDNIHLKLSNNAILKAIPNSSTHYNIVRIENVSNVEVTGGQIYGERDEHTGTSGEWGMGIAIGPAKNIEIKGVTIKDCWGDGIYINGPSQKVVLDEVVCDSNRRQGMTVTNVDGLIVKNSTFSNTNGKAPRAGIDLEPNMGENVKNLMIENCNFYNNESLGLHMWGSHGFVSEINVKNIRVKGNPVGVSMAREGIHNIIMSDVYIADSRDQGLRIVDRPKNVKMSNVKIINSSKNAITISRSSNIIFSDFLIKGYEQGVVIDQSNTLDLSSFSLSTDKDTAVPFEIKNSANIDLDKIKIQKEKLD